MLKILFFMISIVYVIKVKFTIKFRWICYKYEKSYNFCN